MKKIITISLLILAAPAIRAGVNKGNFRSANASANKVVINCNAGAAKTDLDINNVRTKILTDGDMWWDLQNAAYEIPKGSGLHSMFSGALWIGGTDVAGNLKVAAQTYRQTGNDFWPGAIDTSLGSIDASRCQHYDKHWKVTKAEVQDFITNGTLTNDILTWPGNGDAAFNESQFLAPFFDANGDGIYNTADGDYPYYNFTNNYPGGICNDYIFGDQTLWWVFNDVGNIHSESGGDAIGLEIRAQAFAFQASNDLNNCTFYKYQIINRSSQTIDSCYFGQWADPDLGNALDDYVGCHVMKGLGYCYNGVANDAGAGGYGLNPPAIGIDFLQGPLADPGDGIDNDKDGTIDEPGEQIIMSSFLYYNNTTGTPNGNPSGAAHFYNYLRSTWGDNQHMTFGGDGRNVANPECNYMFPDSTDPDFIGQNWTEVTAGNPVGDRRFVMAAGQFTMLPGAVNYITTGVLWARATSGGPLASLNLLFNADSAVQLLFDSCFYLSSGIPQLNKPECTVAPNPFTVYTTITFKNSGKEIYTLKVFDLNGKIIRTIENIRGTAVQFNKGELKAGAYIYSLQSKSGRADGKLIIE